VKIRYRQQSAARACLLQRLADRFGSPLPWHCPLHGLQFDYLCGVCPRGVVPVVIG
jgi:hypothetical protein